MCLSLRFRGPDDAILVWGPRSHAITTPPLHLYATISRHHECETGGHSRLNSFVDFVGETPYRKGHGQTVGLIRSPVKYRFDPILLRQWLRSCESYHQHSALKTPQQAKSDMTIQQLVSVRRFRVIDTVSGDVVTLGYTERYLAFSYVCGQASKRSPVVNLSSSTPLEALESLSDESLLERWPVTWNNVSKTVLDAVCLTKDIGERYLWVDSLCINQLDAKDQQRIIAAMNVIYENAVLTIVAAGGIDSEAGWSALRGALGYKLTKLS